LTAPRITGIVSAGSTSKPPAPIFGWLELVGHKGNRDASGARLKVTTAAGRTLYNHVSVSSGFMSSSDKRVHFGLGAERAVRSLEIRWPGGKTQTLENPPIDRVLKIDEQS
jgi:hypothetical protein